MKISINIPTFRRAGDIDTFSLLPNAFYWVHEFEIKKYKNKHKGIKIKKLPNGLKGNIASVRNYILKNQDGEMDAILLIDDDVKNIAYWEKNKRVKINDEKKVKLFLLKYTSLAMDMGVKLWGINNTDDRQNYNEYHPFSMLRYISASFSCFLKGNDLFHDIRFNLKEDYDMTLQQLNKYRKVLRINKAYLNKKGAEQPGGCAIYRNIDKEKEQIKLLQKKWGDKIVRLDDQKISQRSNKKRGFDINPIIKAPIRGV